MQLADATHRMNHLNQKRLALAFLVTLLPLLGTVAAVALWTAGIGPGPVGLGLFAVMYVLTMIGLEVGYHRLLTHRSFDAHPSLRSALAILGSMGLEGAPIWWVAIHRRHHTFSDRPEDPHSPNLAGPGWSGRIRGLFHGHVGWMFTSASTGRALIENFPRDLQRDERIRRINKQYFRWALAGLAIPAVLGGLLTWSVTGALIGLLWGGLVRAFLTTQFSYTLNSLCHLPIPFGRRRLRTAGADNSHDNWLLVIPTLGQGYHNRHHAFPRVAVLGAKWWHLDLGGWLLTAFERLGWATNVRRLHPDWRSRVDDDAEDPVLEARTQRSAS